MADAPTFSMADSSIATYSNGKILGLSEGTTTLTASLYGLTATIVPTINVHDCNKRWDQGKITKQPTNKHEGEKLLPVVYVEKHILWQSQRLVLPQPTRQIKQIPQILFRKHR